MKAYYTETKVKNKKKFVYIKLDIEDAKKIFEGLKDYTGDKEVHITTNNSFDVYIAKRLEVPLLVQICQTHQELNTRLALIGVYL